MDAKLKVVGGKASKGSISLKLPTVIGRSRKAGLTIAHPMISRKHCELYEADGLLMIRDLDSLNGTVIGERRVKEAPLPPEAEFSIGPLTLRAEYEYSGDLSALPEVVLSDKPAPQPGQQEPWTDTPEPISVDQMTETPDPSDQPAIDFAFLEDFQGDKSSAAEEEQPAVSVAASPAPVEKEPVVAPSSPASISKPTAKKPKGLASMFKGAKKKSEKEAQKPAAPTPSSPEKPAAAQQPPVEEDFPFVPHAESEPAPPKATTDKPADEDFDIDSFLDGLK